MKTKDELNALKMKYESLASKLKELSSEELRQVTGGAGIGGDDYFKEVTGLLEQCGDKAYALFGAGDFWRKINEAQTTTSVIIRKTKITEAIRDLSGLKNIIKNEDDYIFLSTTLEECLSKTK